jgi:protein-S-isoprenylcysteine O-methyltransferase Ste14
VFLFHGVTVLVALVVLLPAALFPVTPGFSGKAAGVSLYVAACAERIWAMYVRQGLGRVRAGAGRDWTAIAVGYAYPLTLGGAVAEFLLRQHAPPLGLFATGLVVYATGVAWRYWAFRVLRHQWHVDVSDTSGERHLVRVGPYRLMRHPLYFGACLEIVGIPLFLGAWGALLFGVLIFIPLEVARGYYEERFLRELFGADYRRYADDVWAFFPLPVRPRHRS